MEVVNETVARAVAEDAVPLFLREWRPERRGGAGWLISLGLHALAALALCVAPSGTFAPSARTAPFRLFTPLIAPPAGLTQKAPNRGPVAQEVTLDNLTPQKGVRVPPGAPATLRTPARIPGAPELKPAATPSLPEPPRVEAPQTAQLRMPPPGMAETAAPPPPRIQTEEKPKLAFETPGLPNYTPRPSSGLAPPRRLTPPDASVTEAARTGGGVAVGDLDMRGPGGLGPGVNLPPRSGRPATALELQSDPQGVDFKPYLITILASVKRNWLAVYPESARLGRTGRVQIQFAIARNGSVPKLVIAQSSGTTALDLAAVAGIDSSTPFPPLPDQFQGSQVRLQFTFTYNMR